MKRYIKAATINILDNIPSDDNGYCFRSFTLDKYASPSWIKRNLNPDKYTKSDCEKGFEFNPNIKDPYKRYWTQVKLLEFLAACIKYRVPFNLVEAHCFFQKYRWSKDGGGTLEGFGVNIYIEVTENGLEVVYDTNKYPLDYNKDIIYTAQEIQDFMVNTFKKILRKLDDKLGFFRIGCNVTADFKWNAATNKEDFGMDVGPIRVLDSLSVLHLEDGKWKVVVDEVRPERIGKTYKSEDLSWYGLEEYADKY